MNKLRCKLAFVYRYVYKKFGGGLDFEKNNFFFEKLLLVLDCACPSVCVYVWFDLGRACPSVSTYALIWGRACPSVCMYVCTGAARNKVVIRFIIPYRFV